MHGKGKFIWADNKIFIGDYKNDKKEGKGKYYWTPDKYYDGEWLNGKQHGEGTIYNKGRMKRAQFRFGKLIKQYSDPAMAQTNDQENRDINDREIDNGDKDALEKTSKYIHNKLF
jgi:hypothetical protein